MDFIRLKSDLGNLKDRMQYQPEIIEFHLKEDDLLYTEHLIHCIQEVKESGADVYLHHPMKVNGMFLDILSNVQEVKDYYVSSSKILADICKQENIFCVVHAHYAGTESSLKTDKEDTFRMAREIEKIEKIAQGRFLWEDTIEGLFSYQNPHLIDLIIKPLNLPIVIDVSHSFISLKGSNDGLEKVLKDTAPYAKYFHLVDSMGNEHDSLPLGEGLIEWGRVKPYVEKSPFIFEIGLNPPYDDCTPMMNSVRYFNSI